MGTWEGTAGGNEGICRRPRKSNSLNLPSPRDERNCRDRLGSLSLFHPYSVARRDSTAVYPSNLLEGGDDPFGPFSAFPSSSSTPRNRRPQTTVKPRLFAV